jgi:hypothetical protein
VHFGSWPARGPTSPTGCWARTGQGPS